MNIITKREFWPEGDLCSVSRTREDGTPVGLQEWWYHDGQEEMFQWYDETGRLTLEREWSLDGVLLWEKERDASGGYRIRKWRSDGSLWSVWNVCPRGTLDGLYEFWRRDGTLGRIEAYGDGEEIPLAEHAWRVRQAALLARAVK